jgi:hypothetical protein
VREDDAGGRGAEGGVVQWCWAFAASLEAAGEREAAAAPISPVALQVSPSPTPSIIVRRF